MVDMLARESRREFEDIADEGFRDLLAKHGRVVALTDQLKRSLKERACSTDDVAPARAKCRNEAKA